MRSIRHRENQNVDHFDMLPFINILLCTLACLLMVSMSMSALSLGPGAGEGWIPTNDGEGGFGKKQPILIEWDGQDMIIHNGHRKERIPLSTAKHSNEILLFQFLDKMAANKTKQYALFAVRPSGFSTFDNLANLFRKKGISIGSEPIATGRPIKLIVRRDNHEN